MTNALEAIRNVAFLGHPSSGKTSLVDALAFHLGANARKGTVADKTSIVDTEPEEQERQHTLQMSCVHAEKNGRSWNLLDTPGYPEFVADTQAAIWASDIVVGVVSCGSGVTFNLLNKMKAAAEQGRGRAIVVTHLDAENADFDALVAELRAKVGEICVPVDVPDQSGPGFSQTTTVRSDPSNEWRKRLMDRVMDACEDEALLETYLETEELSDDQVKEALPKAIAQGSVVPILIANPVNDVGIARVADFLAAFAPHPGLYETRTVDGDVVALDPEGGVVAGVFAVRTDPHVGRICYTKLLRGTLHATDAITSKADEKGHKPGGLFHMVGTKRDNIDTAKPGEIVAFSKIDSAGYGDVISVHGGELVDVTLPAPPNPTISLAVEPKSRADEQKLGEALNKLSAEDPGFSFVVDQETHEMVMSGMSDLHLQVMEARMKRRFGVEIETHLPKISYRETISKPAEGHHRHKKQSGGRGQFGECYVRVKPLEKGAGIVFEDAVVGGAIPRNLIPAVEKGIREISDVGILTSSKVIDIEIELYDGKFHAVDSDEASFKKAGARAFMDGFHNAKPVLLEPMMEMIISVPTDDAGTIFSDLTSQRRAHVLDQWNEADGSITVIKAHAPLSTVQTYHRDLKSQTAGEGSYTMRQVDYAQVPAAEQAKIVKEAGKKHDDD